MIRLVDEQDVIRAVDYPPDDTRAYFRGRCLRQYPEAVAAASWDSVIFDIPGRESLERVPTLEPLRGTRAHVGPRGLRGTPTGDDSVGTDGGNDMAASKDSGGQRQTTRRTEETEQAEPGTSE